MAVYSRIPTSNIQLVDIRDSLNADGSSCSNDVKTFFTNSVINWESKRKPVKLGVDFCQDFNSGNPNYYAGWWKAFDNKCGMNYPSVGDITSLVKAYDGNMNGWTYSPPTGGTSQPYRVGDFAGYYRAKQPMNSGFLVEANSSQVTFSFITVAQNDYTLSWADFPILGNYYFGVYIRKKNGTGVYIQTTSTPIKNQLTPSITITNSALNTNGECEAFFFLAEVQQTGGLVPYGECVPIPYAPIKTFVIGGSSTGTPSRDNTRIVITTEYRSFTSLYIKVVVNTTATSAISGNAIRVRLQSKNWGDSLTSGVEQELPIASFTGSKTVYEGTITINNQLTDNCKVMVALHNYSIIETAIPIPFA